MKLTLGYSPCPNDTFMFHALVKGLLPLDDWQFSEELHDVETLNRMAMESRLDVTKLSFYAWLAVKDRYRLLNSGAALGYGCGPVLIAKRALAPRQVTSGKTLLPGRWTTAHLLFRLWAPDAADRRFAPYDRIFDLLERGAADSGVIIHENRFTFAAAGFRQIVDLGAWWEAETGLPIPLGCIAAKKTLPDTVIRRLETLIRESIACARRNPQSALPYMRRHAQEMDAGVLERHVCTFVNAFSLDLGSTGRAAVAALETRARTAEILT